MTGLFPCALDALHLIIRLSFVTSHCSEDNNRVITFQPGENQAKNRSKLLVRTAGYLSCATMKAMTAGLLSQGWQSGLPPEGPTELVTAKLVKQMW